MKRSAGGRTDSAGIESALRRALLRRVARNTVALAVGEELYGVPSPCIISSTRDAVLLAAATFEVRKCKRG